MFTFYSDDLNQELLKDFFYDLNDAYRRCEKILLALELTPKDQVLINKLLRSVHTIKANLVYVGLKELCPLLQAVEDVLEELHAGRMAYDDLISDMVLLAVDTIKKLVDDSVTPGASRIDITTFGTLCSAVRAVVSAPPRQRQQAIYDAIRVLDPGTKVQRPTPQPPAGPSVPAPNGGAGLAEFGVETCADLEFFAGLALAFEQRSQYWHGSSCRIARLALAMNDAAGRPVDPSQLAAAVYVHDFGMAFLPLELLHKQSSYDYLEQLQLHHHVKIAHGLLSHMERWRAAAEMVSQHHEHCDGRGYPNGLQEAEICDGAKIIAIADAFEACSHSRAHNREPQRPLIRAVLEVNRYAGSQFSQFWVDIFNKVARGQETRH
ncbi:HD domain-containing protein [Exilibacterium tricleocarpae]|uniref:HD domain-containing protein n=1 Tax=Exilibacterium tricleocarpae TaxID=2591008 RepID=A0A545U9F5_9GAMM|nr:HD domain-containing phosphohydrolase [Exilibacterium tricleocarpae]TQV86104.1 HD domain-containing protein [Exilibacterium tricleocarpae]